MFMNDVQIEQSGAEWQLEDFSVSDVQNEATDYQDLLNTVDAARAGLVSDEHDYDYIEDETL